ncbi:MAG: translocation/assembly module TamB [Thermodesulfovibrionales bacterium]|nr:translocation/assembly module TamB [Thermodesulfovibrionales bacterium]
MNKKIVFLFVLFGIFFIFSFLFFRSSYVSERLKDAIFPKLEDALNKKITAERIYINFFPLFIALKDLRVYNSKESEVVYIKSVKGYISFFDLIGKKKSIKKLILKEPVLTLNQEGLDELKADFHKIDSNIFKPSSSENIQLLSIKAIEIDKGNLTFIEDSFSISLNNLRATIFLTDIRQLRLRVERAIFTKKDDFNVDSSIYLDIILKDKILDIKSLKVLLNDSALKSEGFLNLRNLSGEFNTELKILVDSLKTIFGLSNRGEGSITGKGTIKLLNLKPDFKNIFLNLTVKGEIYLETLMELLRVKEKLEGKTTFEGVLSGPLDDIKFSASANLQGGNLFSINIDKLSCNIFYEKGKMRFSDGVALLYGGTASAEVEINLPIVNQFSLNIYVKDVSSQDIFQLIKWDPIIAPGKVDGRISSTGKFFNPNITFVYKNLSYGKNIKERIREIRGEIISHNGILNFKELKFLSQKSNLTTTGIVDLNNKRLSFTGIGETADFRDILDPYFMALSGKGSFDIKLTGSFEDPIFEVTLNSNELYLHTSDLNLENTLNNNIISFEHLKTTFIYNKDLLLIKNLIISNNTGRILTEGKIHFKGASKLFNFDNPKYDLHIKASNVDLEIIASTIKGLPNLKGLLNVDFSVSGIPASLSFLGNFLIEKPYFDRYPLSSSIKGSFTYKGKEFSIHRATLENKDSYLNISGMFSLDKRFKFNAESKRIRLKDISIPTLDKYYSIPLELFLDNLTIRGEGTIENPNIQLKANLNLKKNNNTVALNRGSLDIKVFQRETDLNLSLFNENIRLKGKIGLTENLPWSIILEFKPLNYASLLKGTLKDMPDDMVLNFSGKIVATGDRKTINGDINFNRLYLSSFGVWLINNNDLSLTINNNLIRINKFHMQGIDTEFTISGTALLGEYYDLLFEGTSSIAPLKAFSRDIESLKGKAYFVISLTGNWDSPTIDGGIDLVNGSLTFKHTPYRLTSIAAYLYVDGDKVVVKNIDGKVGGGEFSAHGTISLHGLNIKNFLFISKLKDITIQPMKDVWMNFDGDLYYKGTLKSQELTGDIYIKRSSYNQRFEWKSWLLDMRKAESLRINTSKLGQTSLNVRVISDNLIINNNLADAIAKMDILLKGTIGRPILLGKMYTDKGKFYFRSNEFKVLKARIDFISPEKTTPSFDIVAETRIKNYQIKLILYGDIENFNLSLSSDPILNEGDILSLLTVGYLDKQLKGLEGSVGTSEATSFIAGKLQEVLEERIKIITGIDRIQVDPQVSKVTGTINPRITVLKKILDGKMQIVYSVSTANNEQQTWRFEYFIDKSISLIGERDEKGGISGNIKFRFEFK